MSLPFDPADAGATIAPLDLFEDGWAPLSDDGASVTWNHAVRTGLALEIGHQLARHLPGLVLKGGTALQSRLLWPPRRASVDIDLEWPNPREMAKALGAFADRLEHTDVTVDPLVDTPVSHVTYVRFPTGDGGETRVRVDVSPPGSSTEFAEPWQDPPAPWSGSAATLRVPTLETQAAQKLLLAAPPAFGRDLDDHRGRQNFCKDVFDLHSLSRAGLDSGAIQQAAHAEVHTKTESLDRAWSRERVIQGAKRTYRLLAHPRWGAPSEVESLWRAYLRVRPAIRAPFADGDLRTAAGCAHHAAATLFDESFDWDDSWTPATKRKPRRAWVGADRIEPVLEVADGFSQARGLLEAWAKPRLESST